jgi:hypothetical protein
MRLKESINGVDVLDSDRRMCCSAPNNAMVITGHFVPPIQTTFASIEGAVA